MLVYCLCTATDRRRTYIGATKNFGRRLRQHNGELKGGAKYTRGRQWKPVFFVRGFETWNQTLSFEWRLKKVRLRQRALSPLHRRIFQLRTLLQYRPWKFMRPALSVQIVQSNLPAQLLGPLGEALSELRATGKHQHASNNDHQQPHNLSQSGAITEVPDTDRTDADDTENLPEPIGDGDRTVPQAVAVEHPDCCVEQDTDDEFSGSAEGGFSRSESQSELRTHLHERNDRNK